MNKVKRIFSLVLVLTMVLGSFGSVFAAADVETAEKTLTAVPKDVIGTEYEKAVSRLVAFGIVDGYKDGTYKPGNDVTRAEFAKILVEALGIGNATKAAQGKTNFSDVTATHWASGYINVATGQGLLKGYPDGTFKPSAQVSYAEAMTMLVRALGYQDSFLKGTWPGNYVAKAAEAGISSGVKFDDAGRFANRGDVAILVNNTLDGDVVKVDVYKDGTTEYHESEVTLLKDKLDISKYEDTRVIADKIVDDGLEEDEVTVRFLKDIDKKETKSVRKDYNAGDEKDFRIEKTVNPRKLIGEEVSIYMDDKDNIVYIESEDDDRVYFDYIEGVKGKDEEIKELSLVRFDKDYRFAEEKDRRDGRDAVVYLFNSSDDEYKKMSLKNGILEKDRADVVGKVGKFVVKNNEIVYAEIMDGNEAAPWMLVLKNEKGLLEGINQTTEDFDIDLSKDGNYDGVFVYDTLGNKLDVEDIEKGNILYIQKLDYDGDDYAHVVVVKDNVVEGKLDRVKDDRATVGDKQIKATRYDIGDDRTYDAFYSVEGFEEIKRWKEDADWSNDMEDADDEEMVAYLDAAGRIAFLTTETTASSGYKYGIVTRTYADNDRIKIYTQTDDKDGDEVVYKVEEEDNLIKPFELDEYGNKKGTKDEHKRDKKIQKGDVVKFKLNKDGEIAEDEFFVMNPKNTWKMTKDFGKDSIPSKSQSEGEERSFSIENKATIIDGKSLVYKNGEWKFDSDDFGISKWEDMSEDSKNDKLEYFVFTKRNNNIDVDALIFIGDEGASSSSDLEAIYVIDKWYKGGDDYIEYVSYETGKIEKAEVDKVQGKLNKERPYIARIKSSGKVELFNAAKDDLKYVAGTVKVKDGNIITLKGIDKDYKMTSNTVVYEEDTKKSTSNIRKDDAVYFVVENNVNVRAIERLIDSESKDVKNGKDIYETGITVGKDTDTKEPGKEVAKGTVTYINAEAMIVDGKTYEFSNSSILYRNSKKDVGVALGGTEIKALVAINDKVEVTKVDGKVALEIKEVEVAKLQKQITDVTATPASITKALLDAVTGLTHKAEEPAGDYVTAYKAEVKATMKTFDELQAAINAANAKVEKADEEQAGATLNTKLSSMDADTATNKDVKDAREAYNDLTAAGKAKVEAANLAKLEAAEKALKDAKAALKAEISKAEGIFANENSKLKAIEADDALVANIKIVADPDGSGEPEAYRTKVDALNTARATAAANNKKVDDDSETATSIKGYTTTLTNAIKAVTDATEDFDSIVKQAKDM